MAVNAYGQYTISVVDDGVGIKSKQDYYTLSNQKDSLDGAKSYFEKEVSGAVASFSDGAENAPMGVVVDIDPVQDLHGYDNPWPGGGGKNLFNSATFPSLTKNGVTCTNNGDGSFTLNGTASGNAFFDIFSNQFKTNPLPSAEYRLTGVPSGAGSSNFYIYTTPSYGGDIGNGKTFTNTITGGSIFVKSGTTVNNVTIWPMIRLASNGDDTFAPYSNICQISGWTGAKVTRTGRNILPTLSAENAIKYNGYGLTVANVSGGITVTGQSSGTSHSVGFLFDKVDKYIGKSLTISCKMASVGGLPRTMILLCDENFQNRSGIQYFDSTGSKTVTFSSGNEGKYIGIALFSTTGSDSTSIVSTYTEIQLELGSTAHAYEPYQAVTHEIPFSTEVYGGTLNVTTGELVVDGIKGTFSGAATDIFSGWYVHKPSGWSDGRFVLRLKKPHAYYGDNSKIDPFAKSSHFKLSNFNTVNTQNAPGYIWATQGNWNTALICYVPGLGTVDEYLNWFANNPTEFYYTLANPITLTLSPVEIRSLFGDNNVWADTGDVDVKYINEQDLTWETEPLVPNEEGKYLWWKYKITKDDDSTWESDPAVIGMFSDSDRVLANIEKAQNTADFAQGAAQMAQSSANYAQDAADRAQQSANNAQDAADRANDGVENLRNDVANTYVTSSDFSASNERIQLSVSRVETLANDAQSAANNVRTDLSGELDNLTGRVSGNEDSIKTINTSITNLVTTAEGIVGTVQQNTSAIENLQDFTNNLQAKMSLTASGLDISGGDTTSDTHVHINGDGVSITDGTNTPAYFHGQESKMINVEITEILRIGNHKLLARSGGTNTTVVYVGDE